MEIPWEGSTLFCALKTVGISRVILLTVRVRGVHGCLHQHGLRMPP